MTFSQPTHILQKIDTVNLSSSVSNYSWISLYTRDKDFKNRLEYNNFAYKKTMDYCKLEDRSQKKGHFRIAYTQNGR